MGNQTSTAKLVKLADSDFGLRDSGEDIRGRTVLDRSKEEIGDVEALLIDDDERRVRFLEVKTDSFLGLGGKKVMIPVDAITSVDDESVHIDQTREHVTGGPAYDPDLVHDDDVTWAADVYGWYGYAPFWTVGYMYPQYPYR